VGLIVDAWLLLFEEYETLCGGEMEPVIEACFAIQGERVPVDHGWKLFAALSAVAPIVHERQDVAVGPLEGCQYDKGSLVLGPRSRLIIRTPESCYRELLLLAGRKVRVGESWIQIGFPSTRMLRPRASLNARIVVITNRLEWVAFEQELRRQLRELGVQAEIVPGKRRVLMLKRHTCVGWGLGLEGLTADASLKVQERGLGGRRSMGAGFFVPGSLPPGAMATPRDLGLDVEGEEA